MLKREENRRKRIDSYYATVLLVGSEEETEKFAYKIELNAPFRKLSWEATPLSVYDGMSPAILIRDCLYFDSKSLQHFTEDDNLKVHISIYNLT